MGKPSLNYQLHKALEATGINYSKTCKQYMRDIEKYGDFCKREYGCRQGERLYESRIRSALC